MKSQYISGKRIGLGERLRSGVASNHRFKINTIISFIYAIVLWLFYSVVKLYTEVYGSTSTVSQLHDDANGYLFIRYIAMLDTVFCICIIVFIVGMGFLWVPFFIKRFGKGE